MCGALQVFSNAVIIAGWTPGVSSVRISICSACQPWALVADASSAPTPQANAVAAQVSLSSTAGLMRITPEARSSACGKCRWKCGQWFPISFQMCFVSWLSFGALVTTILSSQQARNHSTIAAPMKVLPVPVPLSTPTSCQEARLSSTWDSGSGEPSHW